jgi:hypothetical protein
MEGIKRMPFQGIGNIVRFNWHFYLTAIGFIALLIIASLFISAPINSFLLWTVSLISLSIFLSLIISFYVYDRSNVYQLNWLGFLNIKPGAQLVNIHAGFDETSSLLSKKYGHASLRVFDFYDPTRHTEISIARARKFYLAYPGTQSITTSSIPLQAETIDQIFVLLSAHEIRDRQERAIFFSRLKESLKSEGSIVVLEHLRDLPNFIAYTIGFFHFFSKKEWKYSFDSAGLYITKEIKITPFITAFILQKNGTAS